MPNLHALRAMSLGEEGRTSHVLGYEPQPDHHYRTGYIRRGPASLLVPRRPLLASIRAACPAHVIRAPHSLVAYMANLARRWRSGAYRCMDQVWHRNR